MSLVTDDLYFHCLLWTTSVFFIVFFLLNWGQSFCVKLYKILHYKDPLMVFIYIWRDIKYRSKVLLTAILTPGSDLEVKVMDLEFLYKSQNFCTLYSYIIKTF